VERPAFFVEGLVDGGGGGHARAHRTRRGAIICEGEVLDVLQVRVLERLDHEGVNRQAEEERAQWTPLQNARQTLDDRAGPVFEEK